VLDSGLTDINTLRVLPVNPASPRDDKLSRVLDVLSAGGVVALPTETFYGLAADALDPAAIANVNTLKGKQAQDPVLLLLGERGQVSEVCDSVPVLFDQLASRFWPGPLTLVIPAASRVPLEVTGGGGTVAVRVPGLVLPRRLAGALGRPISGVSANRTTRAPCRTAGEVAAAFPEGLAMILDGGPTPGGAPSTILDLSSDPPRLLREGLLPFSALRPFVEGLEPARR